MVDSKLILLFVFAISSLVLSGCSSSVSAESSGSSGSVGEFSSVSASDRFRNYQTGEVPVPSTPSGVTVKSCNENYASFLEDWRTANDGVSSQIDFDLCVAPTDGSEFRSTFKYSSLVPGSDGRGCVFVEPKQSCFSLCSGTASDPSCQTTEKVQEKTIVCEAPPVTTCEDGNLETVNEVVRDGVCVSGKPIVSDRCSSTYSGNAGCLVYEGEAKCIKEVRCNKAKETDSKRVDVSVCINETHYNSYRFVISGDSCVEGFYCCNSYLSFCYYL